MLSSQLASELGRQRRLYDDLLNKTEQIQSVCWQTVNYIYIYVFTHIFSLSLQMVDEVAGARFVYMHWAVAYIAIHNVHVHVLHYLECLVHVVTVLCL